MASQISHIIYAKKYFEKYPSKINKDEFILGSVFPDIRRIDKTIKRKDTHLRFYPVDLNFEELTSFQAGWKFHLYCDMRREEILNNYNFYSSRDAVSLWGLPSKMLEDEIVYGGYDNWEKLVNYFNNAPRMETGINVSHETFSLWYAIIARYAEKNPDSASIKIFLSKQPALANFANDIINMVDKFRKDKKIVKMLQKVSEEIV